MTLSSMIRSSKHVVVLTGAGMDTDSNIPDFRGKEGWWRNIDPRTVATIDSFHHNYSLFHQFYSMRLRMLDGITPHKGHYVLSELESKGLIKSIVTQNVAGLHKMAGSRKVYELHGSIRSIRCNSCNHTAAVENFLKGEHCKHCGNKALRPGVVLFGEMLPSDTWEAALKEVEKSDLLIVIGTSLEVYPVNQLPMLTKGKTVLINKQARGSEGLFDVIILGKAREVLEALDNSLAE